MTVVHVLASTRADHGGTSRSVPALCEALDAEGVEVHLVTAVPADPTPDQEPILPGGGVHVHRIEESTRLQRTLRSPLQFYRRLWSVIENVQPDVIHDHGAWLPSNAAAAWVARRRGAPPRRPRRCWAATRRGRGSRPAARPRRRTTGAGKIATGCGECAAGMRFLRCGGRGRRRPEESVLDRASDLRGRP